MSVITFCGITEAIQVHKSRTFRAKLFGHGFGKNHVYLMYLVYLESCVYRIKDIFGFIYEIKNTSIEPNHILVFYDVPALFTNVPLKETIDILVDKAFEGDWFNKTHSMQLQKHQRTDLLENATSNQLFISIQRRIV